MPVQRTIDPEGVRADLPLKQSTAGGSGAFLVRADDNARYWCKALNNPQHPRVPINEQIVARLGQLIGAGVCNPMLVYIPAELSGWEYRDGYELEEGWVHGSSAIDGSVETRSLDYRADDDNRRRQAGFFALHDWLSGGDSQWLLDGDDENKYYSHDHGHYFAAQGGPGWTADSLAANPDAPAPLGADPAGVDTEELSRLSDALEALEAEEIASNLAKLPSTWPVSDEELDAVLSFVDGRREPAAERLRSLIPEEDGA